MGSASWSTRARAPARRRRSRSCSTGRRTWPSAEPPARDSSPSTRTEAASRDGRDPRAISTSGYYLAGHRSGARLSLSLREEQALATELSDVVGHDVDLRNLGDAPLELRGRVLEEGVRIFSGDDVERVGLERDLLG